MSKTDRTHSLAIGARLRRVRHQQGMSLADVQARSEGRWKAVVVGAYERGDRTVTLSRLADLAEFYDVPLGDLLPDPGRSSKATPGRISLDLVRLDASPARSELAVLARYASRIARKRGDHNGRILTLRNGDLETVALAVDLSPEELQERLEADGILLHLDAAGEPVATDATAATTAQDATDDVAVTIDITDPSPAPRPR
jgi:transcriptional regulator with XRE-family HTH domain